MMTHEPKCIQWKRQGAQRVMSKTANMSREQELVFWREKTEELRVCVMMEAEQPIARKPTPSS
uniref:Uncharacterized protein n=1 Tax=Candidatus Kentrum sp. SD TaxID=2126332 RepID=A0A450YW74_9GAMM|nr:MAG: hypothetical protein BECKSD772F_GA0070984_10656 [Candidatus Kentron sp. SD]VFK45790.1 MAG: hypothetical protein BECKSD772E_GA0070983_10608 [Candidatus Kentron sp. SD]